MKFSPIAPPTPADAFQPLSKLRHEIFLHLGCGDCAVRSMHHGTFPCLFLRERRRTRKCFCQAQHNFGGRAEAMPAHPALAESYPHTAVHSSGKRYSACY